MLAQRKTEERTQDSHGARAVVVLAERAKQTESSQTRELRGREAKGLRVRGIRNGQGVSLTKEQQEEVAEVAQELQKYCVAEPWDVVYCSNPTSPGGGFRIAFGRLVFKTKEMIQAVEAPDTVRNKVSFSALGFLDEEVSLKGKLKALDDNWIQVIFEAPQLKVGPLEFQYSGESEVKLQITYIDEKIRLGKGSRGSLFVFQRRK
ncbi:unnamed protein product [Dovyalis caffra]|uniref:Plastid lipid-associated protein/fibrillin conserved domain-containing protein n=1 Tax=Dovyalis caffra TaxID=77055 RepID=A0AAV1SLM5_9ROSI|nr:unnamed protein product [Dovyalis caffra]